MNPVSDSVITTPQQLRDFHSDGDQHGKPLYSNLGWYLGQVLGSCVGLLTGDNWKKNRRIFDPAFTHSATSSRISTTERAAKEFVDKLPASWAFNSTIDDKSDKEAFSFPIVRGFQKYPFLLAASVIYGDMTAAEETDLWALAEKRLGLSLYLFIGGPYRYKSGSWLDRKAFGLLEDFTTEWRKYNERIVHDRRARAMKVPIVSYWDSYDKQDITLENLMHTLDEMLMTNLDVTTHVVTWLITLVADNEDAKVELLREMEENSDQLHEYLTKSDTHLQRCFQESLRLRPPLMFTAGESSPSIKTFDGISVKPNTMILVDVLAINVRNTFWGTNSEAFVPSRFKSVKPSDLRYNLVMFGFGGRKCPGQYLGAQLAKALLVHLLRQYDVKIIRGSKGQSNYETDESTWVPMADVDIQLTKRAN